MDWALALVALALLGVAAISRRLSGTPITPAILFVAFGLLVGPEVLDGIDLSSTSATVRLLAEATLALVLFSDASRIDLGALRRTVDLPVRLLGIGLPLTIALGAVAAAAIFGALTIEESVILAVVLAPTDAALGQAVVTDRACRSGSARALNVESGLNDGICVPLLFAAVAFADVESEISGGRGPATLLLEEIGYGALGGVVAGLLDRRHRHPGRPARPDRGAVAAGDPGGRCRASPTGSRAGSHGSGFIAAFVAGIVFRLALRRDPEELNQLTEEVGSVLNGVTFVLFGAILLGPALTAADLATRPLRAPEPDARADAPGAIAMFGSRARAPTVGFLGWFGPRGLASIVFAVIVVEESHLAHETPDRARDLRHRGALGPRPRPDRRPARRPLRPLVRAAHARAGAADGERPGRGHEAAPDSPGTRRRQASRCADPGPEAPQVSHRESGLGQEPPRPARPGALVSVGIVEHGDQQHRRGVFEAAQRARDLMPVLVPQTNIEQDRVGREPLRRRERPAAQVASPATA